MEENKTSTQTHQTEKKVESQNVNVGKKVPVSIFTFVGLIIIFLLMSILLYLKTQERDNIVSPPVTIQTLPRSQTSPTIVVEETEDIQVDSPDTELSDIDKDLQGL